MKTAVSIPDPLFAEAEAEAKKLGISRSRLHQLALEEFIQRQRDAEFTQRINDAVAKDGGLDPEDELWLDVSQRTISELLKDDK